MSTFICLICQKPNIQRLGRHLSSTHAMNLETYYRTYTDVPICKVCYETDVMWVVRTNTFSEFCSKSCAAKFSKTERDKREGRVSNEARALRERIESGEELLTCQICGKQYLKLSTHVTMIHSMSFEEYTRTFANIPTCLMCENPVMWDQRHNTFSSYCSHSCVHKHIGQDEDLRQIRSDNMKEFMSVQTNRDNISEKTTERHALPGGKDRVSEMMKEVWSRAEFREKMTEIQTSDEYRNKISDRVTESYKENGKKREWYRYLSEDSVYFKKYFSSLFVRNYEYKQDKMISPIEIMFAKTMDRNKVQYEYEPFFIYDGRVDSDKLGYAPDFYLPEYRAVIEIKTFTYEVEGEKSFYRINLCEEYGYRIFFICFATFGYDIDFLFRTLKINN